MSGFLSRLFGKGEKKEGPQSILDTVKDTLEGVFEKAGFQLYYDVKESTEEKIVVELHGEDEGLLTEKDGQLLDALQFLTKRVLQHRLPETKVDVFFDSNGYREEMSQELIKVADKLKALVLEKKKAVYFRALPPKDRKIVHQHLAEDARVSSRSIGEGLYKKIKIFLVQEGRQDKSTAPRVSEEAQTTEG